ncbi:MAG: hypothetical protein U5R48_18380 [Gammaproteobacteria bacterium]|nr:hypothetical protein [Gammaproteobacteria bacterium]
MFAGVALDGLPDRLHPVVIRHNSLLAMRVRPPSSSIEAREAARPAATGPVADPGLRMQQEIHGHPGEAVPRTGRIAGVFVRNDSHSSLQWATRKGIPVARDLSFMP